MDLKDARRLLEEVGTRTLKDVSFDSFDLVSAGARSQKYFDHCSFVNTDLRFATLDGASFRYCNFTGANLRGRSLRGASFAACNFTGSDLRDADLTWAQFSHVNVGTDAGRTVMTGVRLSDFKGDTRVLEVGAGGGPGLGGHFDEVVLNGRTASGSLSDGFDFCHRTTCVPGSVSVVGVEVELWYRREPAQRSAT
ncbi:pentapeptide repeat-containing protein [Branchiibius cervicis]|uniref:Pentapeptide repeat-containing protein n=1 Tax=Branchiibius cervicis TaxID=908252 RepID=A0ABW2ARF4_9MICO